MILTLKAALCYSLSTTLVFYDESKCRDACVEICKAHDVKRKKSETQRESALAVQEGYRKPIRCTFRKLLTENQKARETKLTEPGYQSRQQHTEIRGLCSSALVFGEFLSLRFFIGLKVRSDLLTEWARASLTANKTMAETQSQSQLNCAFQRKSPKVSDYVYFLSEKVLI